MYKIYKTSLASPIDYAAEELKKYLRMMMPYCGEIAISYDPNAKDGFRLGLMQDFGLDVSDAEDVTLDDILYINTDAEGGIIAGDNARSVLLSVYEYLRQEGCRWHFPGTDGEFIPTVDALKPVTFRHKPSCRYRGQCNEGAEFQDNMIAAIDFTPKLGMNIFMIEFKNPIGYYKHYYNHIYNETNRAPEPINHATIMQWKRQCEAEIAKRGLQFHDMGHGWSMEAIGIDTAYHASDRDNDALVTDEQRQYLALSRGERKLVGNVPNYTQFCMSNTVAREKIVKFIADYSEKASNVDYMHVWLGDAMNRHCECDECRKKTPSDWYVIMLNELDAELTARGLKTKIVFIAYIDTMWAPEVETIKNQERFTLLFAPISRKYTESLVLDTDGVKTVPFKLNENEHPKTIGEMFMYLDEWREKTWKGKTLAYEYHFWRHQYYDVANVLMSRVINDDIRAYLKNGVDGVIQDGSQRSFFPTGLAFYTYARSLFDSTLTYEEIEKDYFSTAFGEDWEMFRDYLKKLGDAFDARYLEGELSADMARSKYYNPAHAESLKRVKAITEEGREIIKAHYNMPYRIQTASVRILERHTRYADMLADALIPKTDGKDDEAMRLFEKLQHEFGKEEAYMENSYDHFLACYALNGIFSKKTFDIIH